MAKNVVKQKGGRSVTRTPKKIGVRAQKQDKFVDEASLARKHKSQKDLKEKRELKTKGRKVTGGFDVVGDVSFAQDLEDIVAWAKSPGNKKYVPFLYSLIRNGHINRAFDQQQEALPEVLGARLVSEAGCKWRAVGGMASTKILSKILDRPDILNWFKPGGSEERLSYDVGHKMLLYCLGVDDSTGMPANHQHAAYEVPLVWLCKQRWEQTGRRLEKVTRQTADAHSDYFVLSADGQKLQATFAAFEEVALPFKLDIAEDFVISNPGSYASSRLISETVGADQNIARAWQRSHPEPVHNAEFHFPDKTALNSAELDFENTSAASSSSTSGRAAVRLPSARRPLVPSAQTPA